MSSEVDSQTIMILHLYVNLFFFVTVSTLCTCVPTLTSYAFPQTIKCLLIYPNPESALNEEAGKLLQERYDDYSSHARMMTEIHARPPRSSLGSSSAGFSSASSAGGICSRTLTAEPVEGSSQSTCSTTSETVSSGAAVGKKRPLSDKSMASSVNGAEKKKKDKKKALKRL